MTDTFDKLKYGAKLTAGAGFSFIKINLFGFISTLIVAIVASIVLTQQSFNFTSGPPHGGGQVLILMLIAARPVAFILAYGICVASPFLLFALGNKYVLMKTINKVIADKGDSLIYPLIESVLNKLKQKQPDLLKKGADHAKLKLKLLQEIKESDDNKWAKRITTFGLNKVNLNEVDLGAENLSFTEIIKLKIVSSLQDISKPSKTFFWLIIGAQWLVLLLIIFRVI